MLSFGVPGTTLALDLGVNIRGGLVLLEPASRAASSGLSLLLDPLHSAPGMLVGPLGFEPRTNGFSQNRYLAESSSLCLRLAPPFWTVFGGFCSQVVLRLVLFSRCSQV